MTRHTTLATTLATALAALVLTACAGPALAQSAEDRAACEPDVWRLCAGHIPNIGAIAGCLKTQRSALSPACRVVMDRKSVRARSAEAQ